MTPFLGQITMFAGNFAPVGFALCQGQLLSIPQNAALFDLIGTTYGGNGTSTFALPNLQGATPIHQGQSPGTSNYTIGEQIGDASVTLMITSMPGHSHNINTSNFAAATRSPAAASLAVTDHYLYSTAGQTPNSQLKSTSILAVGGGQAHNNRQPYLAVSFIIALQGVFPSRP